MHIHVYEDAPEWRVAPYVKGCISQIFNIIFHLC